MIFFTFGRPLSRTPIVKNLTGNVIAEDSLYHLVRRIAELANLSRTAVYFAVKSN